MSKSDAWMPLHIGDYLSDTMRLTTVQHGAYLLLLMQYWKSGPLADDDEELAGIVRMDAKSWDKIKAAIRRFFVIGEDGLLHQKRADAERTKASIISQKRRDAVAQRADRQSSSLQQDDVDDGSNGGSNGQQDANNEVTNVTGLKARLNTHAGAELQPPLTKESKKEPPIAPLAEPVASPQAAQPTERRKPRSHLSPDWEPDAAQRAYAKHLGLEVVGLAVDFKDYWIGHGKPMADWTRVWQRWCRTAYERARSGPRAKQINGFFDVSTDDILEKLRLQREREASHVQTH